MDDNTQNTEINTLNNQINNFELFNLLVDNSFDIISILADDGTIKFESKALKRILGYDNKERIGENVFKYVHPDDLDYVVNEFMIRNEKNKIVELRLLHKNGSWRWFEAIGQDFTTNSQINGIIVNSRDITERKDIENKLIESEQKYRLLTENTTDGIALIEDNQLKYISEGYLKILDYEANEVINMTYEKILELTHSDDYKFLKETIENAYNNKYKELKYEYRIRTKSGKYVWIENRTSLQYKQNGTHLRSIVHTRNITERKQTEIIIKEQNEKLQKLNDDKNRFMRILGHDLRTPFNSLLGFSDLLLKNLDKYDKEKIRNQVKSINSVSRQTHELLEQLLLWAKTQSGKLELKIDYFDFSETTNDLIKTLSKCANEKKIKISCFEAEKTIISADLNMFKTILRNLILNAIKFTDFNGQINVYAQKNQSNITIIVSDNGIGIDKNVIPKLWEINENYSTIGTNNEKGTGFGLTLCKELVEKHDGKIWVESEVGKGSDFKFTLPLINENETDNKLK
ncbi:MAG: PAS domain-containing sensor histidine kinase [Bacteroidales bacterium]|nr:PAS domain-containing sensor histidine kinase [Bacteroidales bacterium]